MNSTTASHHCAARCRSARPSQTTSVVQQASPPGQWVARLAAERDRHRLVEQRHALLDAALSHDRAADLGQGHALDVRVGQLVGDLQGCTGVLLGGCGIDRTLGVFDRQPAELRDRALTGEPAPSPRQPSCRRRVLAVDARLPG